MAHEQVGKLVSHCLEQGTTLDRLSLKTIQKFAPESGPEVRDILKPQVVLRRRRHKGSTGLVPVEEQISHWEEWIERAGRG